MEKLCLNNKLNIIIKGIINLQSLRFRLILISTILIKVIDGKFISDKIQTHFQRNDLGREKIKAIFK